ncbi:Diacylglycerol kinase [Aphelenchoides bicaudatus]|nr:Diacylglycerol kinase [Aphelenchoides bicaudatus]
MTTEGQNVDANLMSLGRDHGHLFVKKTFGKPQYCHHCTEKIWGMLSQGYFCEICNFVCHDRCLRTVVSYCSSIALQLIKNPVAHTWSEPQHIKRKFCCVCRRRTDDMMTIECEVCEYYVHVDCVDLGVSIFKDCREAATFVPSLDKVSHKQYHHMREGNVPRDSKCIICKKLCYSPECFTGLQCEWCFLTAHALCYKYVRKECDFGILRKIMLPPNSVTIPRTELPMEQLLNIQSTGQIDGNRKVSSPSRTTAEEGSSFNEEKETADNEILRVYDGNNSLRNQVFRLTSVPKNSNSEQIRDLALRRFHINDNPDNYYVTQAPFDATDEEEPLEDPIPLRNLKRPDGKRAQIFIRYKDDPDKAQIKVYGGWLRIPITFIELSITKDTLVQDVLCNALDEFGMDGSTWNKYSLIEVSLERGVAERTANPQENMLQLVRNLRKDSLRRYYVVRFYVQEKEDPHDHAVFVGNLPPSLQQRRYERILLKLLGAKEKPFTAIGPIYFEYGSLIITFNTPKAATAAVQRLQNATYKDKKLTVLCLPNVQTHMLPPDIEPLLVLVNVKSGGCQGLELMTAFRRLLNPFQVFDVLKGGPLVGFVSNVLLYSDWSCLVSTCSVTFQSTEFWLPVATVQLDGFFNVWTLQNRQDAACFSPPCGIVPLGTGNDLSRVLRWGGGYTGEENPLEILQDIIDAEEVRLDRWAIVFHEEERSQAPNNSINETTDDPDQTMNNPEDQTQILIMNNYFGIGLDADVCLQFHNRRDANPEKFSSRLFNKTQYVKIGLQKVFFERNCKDLWKRIELEVDGKIIDLPPVEGIIILNLLSWGSGANPWGTAREEAGFQKPTHYDGLLEVVGISDISRLGLIQSKLAAGLRIAQGGSIKITTKEDWPVQVDGEPHIQSAGTITILKSALRAKMLKKAKKSRRSQQAKLQNSQHNNSNNDSSPSTSHHNQTPHLGVSSQSSQQPSEDQSANAENEEMDAFL